MATEQKGLSLLASFLLLLPRSLTPKAGLPLPDPHPSSDSPSDGARQRHPSSKVSGTSQRKDWGPNGRAQTYPGDQGGLPEGGALQLGFLGWAGAGQASGEGVIPSKPL